MEDAPDDASGFIDLASLLVSFVSLAVAIVALILAYRAWRRPFPADPTRVPSWGFPPNEDRRVIRGPADALDLLQFLEDNAGRKVRIRITLDPAYFDAGIGTWLEPDNGGFTVPVDRSHSHMSLIELARITQNPPTWAQFTIQGGRSSPDRMGMVQMHGIWQLNGYFACLGFVGVWTGTKSYNVFPLTPVEAVT
ncbi:hypothetical protein ACI79O_17055 [Geodermatophilus sp. SYSU D00696]